MASKNNSVKKSKAENSKGSKPKLSAEQRRMHRQQVIMSIFGLMLVVAMVVALFAR